MEPPTRVTFQPGFDLWVFMGGIVVDHGLDGVFARHSPFDGSASSRAKSPCSDGNGLGIGAAARSVGWMRCIGCGSTAVSERSERTTQGYRRFRCRDCRKQFNERSESLLNRTQYPSDVIALVVLWRLRHKLSLRDRPEMFRIHGIGCR